MSGFQHVVRPRVAPSSLRAAPAALTPVLVDRFIELADRLGAIREDVAREAEEAGQRRAIADMFSNVNKPLPARPAPSPGFAAELGRAALTDRRPIAASREPCVRCQTRGDIGCAHQRPMEAR